MSEFLLTNQYLMLHSAEDFSCQASSVARQQPTTRGREWNHVLL